MKPTVLLTSVLLFTLSLIGSEAVAQCKEGAPCKVGGKNGTVSCEKGRPICTPDLDDQSPERCGGKVCTGGKFCDNNQCVCPLDFKDCGGTCRNLSLDPSNCGACGNVCSTPGTSCQPSKPVIFGPNPSGATSPTATGFACACTPPTFSCGGVCINTTNDPSNCGACGNVCTAPNTVCRNSQCALPDETSTSGTGGTTGNLPLDLVWSTTDRNGLPFNPDWRARSNPALVFEDSDPTDPKVVDVAKACPISDCIGGCAKLCSPGDLTCFSAVSECEGSCIRQSCTKVPVTTDSGIVSGILFGFFGCAHDNWFPATYEGALKFNDYTARGFISSVFLDDDYKFDLTPTDDAGNPNGAGLAGRGELVSEMSFLETVSDFNSTFWAHFRDLVDRVPGDDLSAPRSLFAGRYAIVTGLLGFDRAHETHAELHPIYAMALRENPFKNNTERDCWAIFARNWGNEGFCSSGQKHPLDVPLNRITFRLPQPGATAVIETSRNFDTNSSLTAVSEVGLVQDGAEITFFLGPPEQRTQVNGEVCLRWAIRPGTPLPHAPAVRVVTSAPGQADRELERDQYPGIDLLTPPQLAELARSLPVVPPPTKRAMLAPKRVPFVREKVKAQGPALVLADRPGPVDAQKQARDRQIQSRVCQMLRSHPKRPRICDKL